MRLWFLITRSVGKIIEHSELRVRLFFQQTLYNVRFRLQYNSSDLKILINLAFKRRHHCYILVPVRYILKFALNSPPPSIYPWRHCFQNMYSPWKWYIHNHMRIFRGILKCTPLPQKNRHPHSHPSFMLRWPTWA